MLWTELDDWIFSYENAFGLLTRHFGTLTLEGFGFKQKEADPVRAAGAVLAYTEDNLKCQTGHIRKISLKSRDEVLLIDPSSRRNLELADPMLGSAKDSTLLHVLDCSKTPMGGRLLRQWVLNPLRSVERIVERQDIVGTFKDDPLTLAELRETISGIRDLARITTKLNMNTANPRDLIALSASLALIPGVKNILAIFDLPLIADIGGRLSELAELTTRILDTLIDSPPATANDGGVIREGCSAELDELRSAATEGRNWVAQLQAKEQERTGIKNLKVHYNRVFGFYIEVTKANLENVPDDYIRKQTLVNCERFITPELKEMESKILGADDKAKALEIKLFEELRTYAAGFTREIQQNAEALAEIDALCALADCASRYSYCRPHVDDSDMLVIRGGRHPVLDAMQDTRFIPNDTVLDGEDNRMMIITGPNMAGKSTYIRQTALLVVMAQMGSFIPADSAVIGVADKIFTRVGAADDISRGQSTFMVEMLETANILNNATARSLIILDEIGRGTSTFALHRLVGCGIHSRPHSRTDAVRHALPRTDRTRNGSAGRQKLQRRRARIRRSDHLPASDRPRRGGQELRYSCGETRRSSRRGCLSGKRDPREPGGKRHRRSEPAVRHRRTRKARTLPDEKRRSAPAETGDSPAVAVRLKRKIFTFPHCGFFREPCPCPVQWNSFQARASRNGARLFRRRASAGYLPHDPE